MEGNEREGLTKMRFFLHYNKPLSRQKRENWWTLHYQGQCVPIRHFTTSVILQDRERKTQPKAVVWGDAKHISITNHHAIIT